VVYDGEAEPGQSLMEKFGASGFPFLVALDASGKEIDRQLGFRGGPSLFGWFLELPDRQVPLDDYLKRADGQAKDGRVQLVAAKRLVAADRIPEARKYFARAERSPDKLIAVAATWALGRMDLEEGQAAARRKLAEKICTRYPLSPEALTALQYLVTLEKPPAALVEKTLQLRLVSSWDDGPSLNHLVYLALRGKSYAAALKIAARLEALSDKVPAQLDSVAEVHHMTGDTAKAVAVSQRALAMASGKLAEGLRENLARFQRGQKEEGPDIKDVKPPSFEMERPQLSAAPPKLSPSRRLERDLGRRLPDECAGAAAGAERLRLYVMADDTVRITFAPATPKTLATCAAKVVHSLTVPPGTALLLDVPMVPKPFRDAVDVALKDAEVRCAKDATPGMSVEGVMSGPAGAKPEIVLSAGSIALRVCVEKQLAGLRLPVKTFRAIRLSFK
jgi:hypothetical protein